MLNYLFKLKSTLDKSRFGRAFILIYRYFVSLPLFWIKAFLYYIVRREHLSPNFYGDDEVFDLIINNNKSIARFGDGEIQWMFKDAKGYFGQENSSELSDSLFEVIFSEDESLIVCIPNFFDDMENYSSKRKYSRNVHLLGNFNRWKKVILDARVYGDALMTRVYNGRKNKNEIEHIFSKWKDVFKGRDVVIIEGSETQFGVGNDLLDNALSARRIIGPSENAFVKIESLMEAARSVYSKDVLFLICLGPTATVLASNICKEGFQAIDIGHLDIEYEWFIRNSKTKVSIPGKYVNEAGGAPSVGMDIDKSHKYLKEIITDLGSH